MGRQIEYRALDASRDLPRLRELHDVCFPVKYDDRFYEWLQTPQCICLIASEVASQSSSPPLGEAVVESTVVGFIVGRIKFVDGPLSCLSQPVAYISTFGVDPGTQGEGIGNELLERFTAHVISAGFLQDPAYTLTRQRSGISALLSRLRSPARISQVWLHCLVSDDRVVSFYCNRGFVQVEKCLEYYHFNNAPHDAWVMVREETAGNQASLITKENRSKGTGPTGFRWRWWCKLFNIPAAFESIDDDEHHHPQSSCCQLVIIVPLLLLLVYFGVRSLL